MTKPIRRSQEGKANLNVRDRLLELLRLCTVRIILTNGSTGTGFFIAKNTVVTCLHVVEDNEADKLRLEWNGLSSHTIAVERPFTSQFARVREQTDQMDDNSQEVVIGPDLALLTVPFENHPCVILCTETALDDPLYSYGYPVGYPNGDPVTITFEGFSYNPLLLKLKQGQIRPGASGSPILNLRTGAVCGLITKTRGKTTDLGGRGIPAGTIFSTFPALWKQSLFFHSQDPQWLQILSPNQRNALQDTGNAGMKKPLLLPACLTATSLMVLGIMITSFSDGEQPQRANPYGKWKLTGPVCALVHDLEIDPQDISVLYIALGDNQGIFRSDDGGMTWWPKDLGLMSRSVTDLAVSPHDGAVYAATRKGLWISHDRGDTWMLGHARFRNLELLCVAVSERDPDLLIVGSQAQGGVSVSVGTAAALGVGASSKSEHASHGHLHISLDGGKNWSTWPIKTLNGVSMAFDDSRVGYLASADGGLFTTRDGFGTLQKVDTFPKTQMPGSVAISPINSNIVIVGTLFGGLYVTFDSGSTWKNAEEVGQVQVASIAFSKANAQHVLAATTAGVFESVNAGHTWSKASEGLEYDWCMAVRIDEDGTAYVGTSGGGVFHRSSGQHNWLLCNNGFSSISAVAIAMADDLHLFVGTGIGLFKSQDAGESWRFTGRAGEGVTAVAIEPMPRSLRNSAVSGGLHISHSKGTSFHSKVGTTSLPLVIYTGTIKGNIYRSRDAGASWDLLTTFETDRGFSTMVRSLVVSPEDNNTIYAVVEYLPIQKSSDGGKSWSAIGELACGHVINGVSLSSHNPRVLYAATGDRGMLITHDGGSTWTKSKGLPEGPISSVTESLITPGFLLAAAPSGEVYRSVDGGNRFELLHPAREEDLRWSTVAISPRDDRYLILGTSRGAFISQDAGSSWQALDGGIFGRDYYVNDLKFGIGANRRVFAAMTQGLFAMDLAG